MPDTDNLIPARDDDCDEVGSSLVTNRMAIHAISVFSLHANPLYFKFYDKATAADETDTPAWIIGPILVNTSANEIWPKGLRLNDGISIRAVEELADNGTTGPAANQAFCHFGYQDLPNMA